MRKAEPVKVALHGLITLGLVCGAFAGCGGTTQSNGNQADSESSAVGGSGGNTAGTTSASSDSAVGGTGTTGTTGGACPSLEPALGTACTSTGQRCTYLYCQAPTFQDGRELLCNGGAWALAQVLVCSESGSCPNEPPLTGQPCDVQATPGPCATTDPCGNERQVICASGLWTYAAAMDLRLPIPGGAGGAGGGSEPPVCPSTAPALGAPCCPSHYPPVCDYSLASNSTGSSTGAGGSSFLIAPKTTNSTTSAADVPFVPECFQCGPDLVWLASNACLE